MASTSYTKYNSPQIFSKLIIQFWTVLEFQSMGRSGTMKIYIQLLLVMKLSSCTEMLSSTSVDARIVEAKYCICMNRKLLARVAEKTGQTCWNLKEAKRIASCKFNS
ncbi:uncharacterized protein LOC116002856 isoform X1 [Ipomoea triloba]|uniref:uncharacterized protein LOC116002856 isoform X1 n=1 Tax=Ipomoea triloba TaxID=35885 RepID=UPI00125D90FE|nr:uncharacterized protein LOC116002856 isoform X1 [Ipomoea triloba]